MVNDVSIHLQQFRKLAIAGETGSGKSSLLQMIAGIINPDSGQVYFQDERLKRVPEEKLLPGHPGIAYLSQQFELPHHMRVEEILAYSNELNESTAANLYAICQVDHLLKRKHDQVSGGERQRIALARLLGSSPTLLLLDEPFSNLDPIHKTTLKQVIHDISSSLGITCVLVSHDPLDTIGWADEIIVLKEGRIVQQDQPTRVYYQPVNKYVAGLFGKYNWMETELRNTIFPGNKHRSNCIRPNQLQIKKWDGKSLMGIIESSYFTGIGYELRVKLGDHQLEVFETQRNWQIEDKVTLRLLDNE